MYNDIDICTTCGQELARTPAGEARAPCDSCGGTSRTMFEGVEERLGAHASVGTRVKRPSLPSDQKVRSQNFSGVEQSHKYGKLVRKDWGFDRDADKYFERITDIESGEVLHECIEPLSEHQGHGSAKDKPTK